MIRSTFKRRRAYLSACLGVLLAALTPLAIGTDLDVGGLRAAPGQIARGAIEVPAGAGDGATRIPITVVNGALSGPRLTLVAGIHGVEYAPVLGLQRLAAMLDPSQIAGSVVIVHVANLPAFQGRTIYVGPDDRKNLNRSFPGDHHGTITERIAAVLTDEIIAPSDFLVDVHAGDGNEGLRPAYAAYYAEAGGPEVIATSARMARAFGLGTIVRFRGDVGPPAAAIYTGAQAVARGIPAIDIEAGEIASTDERWVGTIARGSLRLLAELDMLPIDALPPQARPDPALEPVYINDRARVYSEHEGVWVPDPNVAVGEYVARGARIGEIRDYHGRWIADVRAPAAGIMLIRFATPPVNVTDPLAVIGRVDAPAP